eukprot:764442-Hanusia_phi.AAC.4
MHDRQDPGWLRIQGAETICCGPEEKCSRRARTAGGEQGVREALRACARGGAAIKVRGEEGGKGLEERGDCNDAYSHGKCRQLLGPATKAMDRDRLLESISGDGERDVGSLLLYGKSQEERRTAGAVEARVQIVSLKSSTGYGTFFSMRLESVKAADHEYVRHCRLTNEWLEHDVKYKHERSSREHSVEKKVGLASRLLMLHVRDDVKEEEQRLEDSGDERELEPRKQAGGQAEQGRSCQGHQARSTSRRGDCREVDGRQEGLTGSGQVLRRCSLQSFGIKDTVESARSMESLKHASQRWIAGHHELFDPIRERGSYSVELVPGGLQVPIKKPVAVDRVQF